MSFDWKYPLLLIRHGGGYASVLRDESGDVENGDQSIVVFTSEGAAYGFMELTQLLGQPSELNNAREFRTLLQCLKAPVSHVMVDPMPGAEALDSAWEGTVAGLIEDLVVDFSPWNYPAFALSVPGGFVTISFDDDSQAAAMFRSENLASVYAESLDAEAELFEIESMGTARKLLQLMRDSLGISAIAIDPLIEEGQAVAKYCYAMDTLLERYLVNESDI